LFILELEHLVRQLRDSVDLVVSKLMGDLGHGRDHGGRTTEQDLDVGCGSGHVFLDHIGIHKAHSAGPALRRIVEDIMHLELGVLLGQHVQLDLQQNVILVDVCKDKVDLGLVLRVLDNRADDLFF